MLAAAPEPDKPSGAPEPGGMMERMARSRKRKRAAERDRDPLAPYRRIRKAMPAPEQVVDDRRRRLEEEEARREIEEGSS
jgi:hypothetical protein